MNSKHKKNEENYTYYIMIKVFKTSEKDKILKAPRDKRLVMYRGRKKMMTSDFSWETMQVRRQWRKIFKILKGNKMVR